MDICLKLFLLVGLIPATAVLARDPVGAGPKDFAASDADAQIRNLLKKIEPLEPADALKTFELADGLTMELAASEPEITDPIAMAWDEHLNLYVAEMRDYPYNPDPDNVLGRVRILQDVDGDGYYETSTVFADHVHWPSGFAPYKGGVFVSAPPDVLYLKDTDGDNVADVREVVLTGWGTRTAEDIMNNLEWGLDHWIYGASSYNGGEMRPADQPGFEPLEARGRDFRFHPETHALEAIPGAGDFGNSFDDWGNRYVCSSGTHIMHDVAPPGYMGINPFLPLPRLIANIAAGDDRHQVYPTSGPEPWRAVRKQFWSRWVDTTPDMNAGRFPERELALQGWVTGTAGAAIYRGDALPSEFLNNAFIGEPAGNLVIRNVLTPAGATFEARRPTPMRDFLTSTDNWCRPVNATTGPDGCLYILDMYREFIEDPSAIPDDILKYLDMLSGNDRGRVYRIQPEGFKRPVLPVLAGAGISALVDALHDPNGWTRDTAHRLIYERQDRTAVRHLFKAFAEAKRPQTRLHVLWSLEGLGALDTPILLKAMDDAHWAVREHAVRLADQYFILSPGLVSKVCDLADDPSAKVVFQVVLSLGRLQSDAAVETLARIGATYLDNHWMRVAVLNASAGRSAPLLARMLENKDVVAHPDARHTLGVLAMLVGAERRDEDVVAALKATLGDSLATQPKLKQIMIASLADGLARSQGSLRDVLDDADDDVVSQVTIMFDDAATTAVDESVSIDDRVSAVRLLGHAPFDKAANVLPKLFNARDPEKLQLEAIRALSSFDESAVGELLVEHWRRYSPSVRREVAEALFARTSRLPALLDALAEGVVPAGQLDPARRQSLLEHKDDAISRRARDVIEQSQAGSRQAVVDRYKPALTMKGDATRGAQVYEKNCMTCHRIGDKGFEVGPNVTEMKKRSAEELITHILDPNREVQPNYINYHLVTDDGRDLTGIIVAESATSVTLRRAEGVEDTVLRSSIDELESTSLSIMPEEFETAITPQDLADLIAFILTTP